MNLQELYQDIISLAPYQGNMPDDYRNNLRQTLRTYQSFLSDLDADSRPDGWEEIVMSVKKTIKKINDIASNSYKGFPSTAGIQLGNLLKDLQANILYKEIAVGTVFYRMRTIEERRTNISHKEMFHIPINMRRKVTTQRYSTPGYPCLYVGMSVYTCWEEMNRPKMSDCWVSCLKNTRLITLLDLSVPTRDAFQSDVRNYLLLFPLIISCMLPVENPKDIYKPEYIIPQLLTEWIIKKHKTGIFYTSVHKDSGFDFPADKYNNIAIPVQNPLESKVYCEALSSYFRITSPMNYEIELLRNGENVEIGEYGLDEEREKEDNYRFSAFGHLEDWLSKGELKIPYFT
ncbi:MAG: RES domain-containing protein [bacterium]|nr:RES domain-containing protein [bacterium]